MNIHFGDQRKKNMAQDIWTSQNNALNRAELTSQCFDDE